jgi:hypothetical protein
MSYLFGTNIEIYANSGATKGYLGDATGFTFPITIGCYFKYTNHPAALGYGPLLSVNNSTLIGIASINTGTAGDDFRALTVNSAGASSNANRTAADGTYDNLWVPVVNIFAGAATTNNTTRTCRVNTYANTVTESTARDVGTNLKYFYCGEAPSGGGDLAALLVAEIGFWRIELSQANIEAFMAGTPAGSIAASDLLGYYNLRTDLTQTGGILSIGTLGNEGATQTADHPTIATGVRGGLLLTGVG